MKSGSCTFSSVAARLFQAGGKIEELIGLWRQGSKAHGWSTEIWTSPRVAALIQRHFMVSFHEAHVYRLVTEKLGWTFQRPEKVARERSPEKVEKWQNEELPEIKKSQRGKRDVDLP